MAAVAGAVGLAAVQRLSKQRTAAKKEAQLTPVGDHSKKRVVMVTGGTGLVGKGIEAFV